MFKHYIAEFQEAKKRKMRFGTTGIAATGTGLLGGTAALAEVQRRLDPKLKDFLKSKLKKTVKDDPYGYGEARKRLTKRFNEVKERINKGTMKKIRNKALKGAAIAGGITALGVGSRILEERDRQKRAKELAEASKRK